nr:hypothetical protein [Actinospica acidiphila]
MSTTELVPPPGIRQKARFGGRPTYRPKTSAATVAAITPGTIS